MNSRKAYCLITGVAGFIGSHLATNVLKSSGSEVVVGVDNMNRSYDVKLKKFRLALLQKNKNFYFYQINILNSVELNLLFIKYKFEVVFHLAAKAGVRASIIYPISYFRTNVIGTINLLKNITKYNVARLIVASTSSVYSNCKLPYKEDLIVNKPNSPYSASKMSMESILHTWHHLYKIKITVLRFFTVYGNFSRPDMAILKFIKSIYEGSFITIHGNGKQTRDFTHVDDVISAINKVLTEDVSNFSIFNVGCGTSTSLKELINLIELALNKKATVLYRSFNKSDIKDTKASYKKLNVLGWSPKISIQEGIKQTVSSFLKNKLFYSGITLNTL